MILLDYQNNYVGRLSNWWQCCKSFDILAISLSVLYNYFDSLTKLFSNLYLSEFLDVAKSFFVYYQVSFFSTCIQRIHLLFSLFHSAYNF